MTSIAGLVALLSIAPVLMLFCWWCDRAAHRRRDQDQAWRRGVMNGSRPVNWREGR